MLNVKEFVVTKIMKIKQQNDKFNKRNALDPF